jgi:DNA modification methylase
MASSGQKLFLEEEQVPETPTKIRSRKRANELSGQDWTRYSISVWNDIRKTKEELQHDHPAMFPTMLVKRLIDCFTTNEDRVVLDPFMGSGATIIAARGKGKLGIGFEISKEFIKIAYSRLEQPGLLERELEPRIIHADARKLRKYLEPESVDLCVTSPPYWDILSQKRTADYQEIRDYGEHAADLGKIKNYEDFLGELVNIFSHVKEVLKPERYCIVNVMDLRKKDTFYSFHSDLAYKMRDGGWIFDDIIIWDRRQEYNNLRPLGYPSVFRINKVHEYLLIFKKPPLKK